MNLSNTSNIKIDIKNTDANHSSNDRELVNKCDPELYAWLLLSLTHGIGPITLLKLNRYFGSATNIMHQDFETLSKFVNKTIARLIIDQSAKTIVKKSLEWASIKDNRYILHYANPQYPKFLAEIFNAPPILYLEGNLNLLLNDKKMAVVGTRHPSLQGKEDAFRFSRELSNNGFTVVSGMASGIDRYAHLGALQGQGGTIGVIGTGMDVCYPASNRDLFAQVCTDGLLISEFPLQTAPLAQNFPKRNRIIAGLSLGCLIVEATLDSGSLITANLALEMGRDVMAIPGSIHNPLTRGCHKLIKNGAKLIETVNDIFEEFNLINSINSQNEVINVTSGQDINKQNTSFTKSNSSGEQQLTDHPILKIMGFNPINIDEICQQANVSFSDICSELLDLELKGLIQNCGNGCYQRIIK